MHDCQYKDKIDDLHVDVKEIRKDVRVLLSFRSKIVGIVIGASTIIGILIKFIM